MIRSLLSTFSGVLLLAASSSAGEPVKAIRSADQVVFTIGGKPFTTYHVGKTVAKPYFYPLLAPNGAPVTRGWPMEKGLPDETTDHVHQKSAWFCHGDVIPEGIELKIKSADKRVEGIDFWAETPGHGVIACVEVGDPKQLSADHVAVPTRNEWRAADGTKVLDEERIIHVLSRPTGTLIVIESELTASVCPITFGDTKEGSLGVRVNDSIRAAKGKLPGVGTIVNSASQKGEKDVWGLEADWVDYFGPIGDKTAGVAVFDSPGNKFQSAWHARGYGLLAANPFGRGKSGFPARKGQSELVKLKKGDYLKLRYGIFAHNGDTTAGQVKEAYQAFSTRSR